MMLQSVVLLVCLLGCAALPRVFGQETNVSKRDSHGEDIDEKAKCECGVFGTAELAEDSQPLFVQTPIAVTCDEAGNKTCYEMCTSLGKLSKEKGPFILCATVGHGEDLTPSIFSRTCQTGQWYYTGLTAQEPICCHRNDVVPCKPTTT